MAAFDKAVALIQAGYVRGLNADRHRMDAIVIGENGIYRVSVVVDRDRLVRYCTCPNAAYGRPKCSHSIAVEMIFRQFLGLMQKENK